MIPYGGPEVCPACGVYHTHGRPEECKQATRRDTSDPGAEPPAPGSCNP